MWRPEGWENPHRDTGDRYGLAFHNAYEAGADAMYQPAYEKGKAEGKTELLEALAKQVGPNPCLKCGQREHCNRKDGVWEGETLHQDVCEMIAHWEGQQSGYTKGIQGHEARSIRACQETGR